MTSEAVEMTDCAKPGKAKNAFPPFAQSLEIAKAIPTFPQHGDGDLPPKEQKTKSKKGALNHSFRLIVQLENATH